MIPLEKARYLEIVSASTLPTDTAILSWYSFTTNTIFNIPIKKLGYKQKEDIGVWRVKQQTIL